MTKMLLKDHDGSAQRLSKCAGLCIAAAMLMTILMAPSPAQAEIRRFAGRVDLQDTVNGRCEVNSIANFSIDYDTTSRRIVAAGFNGTVHSNPVTGQTALYGYSASTNSDCSITRDVPISDLQIVPWSAQVIVTQTDGIYYVHYFVFSYFNSQFYEIHVQGDLDTDTNQVTRQVLVYRGGQWIGTRNAYAYWTLSQ